MDIVKVQVPTKVVVHDEKVVIIHGGVQGLAGPAGTPGGAGLQMLAAVNLGGHRVVCAGSTGLEYADWNLAETALRVAGITTGAANAGTEASVQNAGEVTEPSWNWDPTKPVYLGPSGVLTQVEPDTANAAFSLVVGFPTNPKTLFITIREPIFLTN